MLTKVIRVYEMNEYIHLHIYYICSGLWTFQDYTRLCFSRWHFSEQSSILYMSDHGQKRPVTGHLCDNGNAAKSLVMLVNWGTLFILSLRTKSQYFLWSLACSLFPANLSLILIAYTTMCRTQR